MESGSKAENTASDYTVSDEALRLKEVGNKLLRQGKLEEAIKAYSDIISIEPNYHIGYSNRSAAHMHANEFQKAYEDARKCVELAPDFDKGYSRLAAALMRLQRYDTAVFAVLRGLAVNSSNEILKELLEKLTSNLANKFLLGTWHGKTGKGLEQQMEFREGNILKLNLLHRYTWAQYSLYVPGSDGPVNYEMLSSGQLPPINIDVYPNEPGNPMPLPPIPHILRIYRRDLNVNPTVNYSIYDASLQEGDEEYRGFDLDAESEGNQFAYRIAICSPESFEQRPTTFSHDSTCVLRPLKPGEDPMGKCVPKETLEKSFDDQMLAYCNELMQCMPTEKLVTPDQTMQEAEVKDAMERYLTAQQKLCDMFKRYPDVVCETIELAIKSPTAAECRFSNPNTAVATFQECLSAIKKYNMSCLQFTFDKDDVQPDWVTQLEQQRLKGKETTNTKRSNDKGKIANSKGNETGNKYGLSAKTAFFTIAAVSCATLIGVMIYKKRTQ